MLLGAKLDLSDNDTHLDRAVSGVINPRKSIRAQEKTPLLFFDIRCRVTCALPPTPLGVRRGSKLGSSLSRSPLQRGKKQMTRRDLILSDLL